jgi:aromatic ring-cleaving dioxygenase
MKTRLIYIFLSAFTMFVLSGCTFVNKKLEKRQSQQQTQASSMTDASVSPDDDPVVIQIRSFEKQLSNKREKEHYSKLLPWFKNDQERLDYLMIPTVSEKQKWALDNKVWNRAQLPSDDMKTLLVTSDIAIGMPMDFVIKSWGEPVSKEISGNPLFKNEKWKYVRSISTRDGYKQERRRVYFEGGRVVGWETE